MRQPVPQEKIREFRHYYNEVRLRWQMGEHIKMSSLLKKKAEDLGFNLRTGYSHLKKKRRAK